MQRFKTWPIRAITSLSILVLVASLAISCVSTGSAKPSFSQDIQAQFEAALTARMSEYAIPGAIVGVWVPGKGEWVVARGKANVETGQVPAVTNKVRIGSVTKTFLATTVLLLAEESKLNLDDKLLQYEPQVPNAANITVRQLLNMTSGLFNYTNDDKLWAEVTAKPQKAWTPQELVDIAVSHIPDFSPGQQYEYCNTNYILLGMIIEKVTGNKVGEEIQKRIIDKLGLTNTSFADTGAMTGQYMHGYMPASTDDPGSKELKDITEGNPSWGWAAGAMISNLDDMKTWVAALAKGTLLTPEMHQQQISFASPNTSQYGLGVMNGNIVIGHSGEILGYNSSVYFAPKSEATIIVLINRYPSKDEGASDRVLTDLVKIISPFLATP
ncbi:MAG: serine hydrolase [Coprothermobacterota bacterium]|nr:serine hydrolase [Coprothermobacterota bacterium]